jgi:hypothetical protein
MVSFEYTLILMLVALIVGMCLGITLVRSRYY